MDWRTMPRVCMASVALEYSTVEKNLGSAKLAKTPTMIITTMTSSKVKPFLLNRAKRTRTGFCDRGSVEGDLDQTCVITAVTSVASGCDRVGPSSTSDGISEVVVRRVPGVFHVQVVEVIARSGVAISHQIASLDGLADCHHRHHGFRRLRIFNG